jgi:A118 family predicted phage portal protein
MFRTILQWLESVIFKMLNYSGNQITTALQSQVGSVYNVSPEMQSALQTWCAMYLNNSDWLKEDVKSMNLPAAIAGEIARTATIEMAVEISGSPRAEFLQEQMDLVTDKIRQQIEYGNAKGGLMFKPYIDGDGLCVDFIHADMFYPLAFDANQNITACVFADRRKKGAYWYTRFESHQMLDGDMYQIRNIAYRSDSQAYLGSSVPLATVPEWADIEPDTLLQGITQPLFGYFRFPQANNIDPTSPLGVSCYARAVKIIEEADKQWSRLLWEFESGERALYVDKSAFEKDKDGKPILPMKRFYRVLNVGASSIAEPGFYKEWSPSLREIDLYKGLNDILRRIEFNCGLSYGVLSDTQVQALTATEIKNSQQRYYTTVTDVQKEIENALESTLYAMDVWATLYSLAPAGTYAAVYSFDDSIIADHDTAFEQDKETVSMGAMPFWKFLERNYGLPEAEARLWVAEALAEKQAAMPQPVGEQSPLQQQFYIQPTPIQNNIEAKPGETAINFSPTINNEVKTPKIISTSSSVRRDGQSMQGQDVTYKYE